MESLATGEGHQVTSRCLALWISDLPFPLLGFLSQSWAWPPILPGARFLPILESDVPTSPRVSAFSQPSFHSPSACLFSASMSHSRVFVYPSLMSLFLALLICLTSEGDTNFFPCPVSSPSALEASVFKAHPALLLSLPSAPSSSSSSSCWLPGSPAVGCVVSTVFPASLLWELMFSGCPCISLFSADFLIAPQVVLGQVNGGGHKGEAWEPMETSSLLVFFLCWFSWSSAPSVS